MDCKVNKGGEHVFMFRSPPIRIGKAIISRIECMKCGKIYSNTNSKDNHVHIYDAPDRDGVSRCCSPILGGGFMLCNDVCPYPI